jgi:hypothetical protein
MTWCSIQEPPHQSQGACISHHPTCPPPLKADHATAFPRPNACCLRVPQPPVVAGLGCVLVSWLLLAGPMWVAPIVSATSLEALRAARFITEAFPLHSPHGE